MIDPMMPTEERWLTPGVRGIGTLNFLADVSYQTPTKERAALQALAHGTCPDSGASAPP